MHISLIKLCVVKDQHAFYHQEFIYEFGFLFFRKKCCCCCPMDFTFSNFHLEKIGIKDGILHIHTDPFTYSPCKIRIYPRFDRKISILSHRKTYFHLSLSLSLSLWKIAVFWANAVEYHLNRQWSSLLFEYTVFSNEKRENQMHVAFSMNFPVFYALSYPFNCATINTRIYTLTLTPYKMST